MSAPFLIPFNFQPETLSVRTSSYTIPAGKYARVVVSLEGASSFTLNGSTALTCSQNSVLASDNLSTQEIDVDTGTGAGNIAMRNQLATQTSPTNGANGWGLNGSAFNEAQDVKVLSADYWVPSGTVINGSGSWRAVVTEYSNIS